MLSSSTITPFSRSISSPSKRECRSMSARTSRARAVCLLVCRCRIYYRGRRTTRLGPGERVVLFKDDGSVCVHSVRGARPVNYMPGPTAIREEDGVIRVIRLASDEELCITVEQVV